jgi:hypothetical protein
MTFFRFEHKPSIEIESIVVLLLYKEGVNGRWGGDPQFVIQYNYCCQF